MRIGPFDPATVAAECLEGRRQAPAQDVERRR
jgi:hypothetical protein